VKKTLLFVCSFATISLAAQVTITKSDLKWTIGNKWYMDVTDVGSISSFTSTGSDVLWDFTSFEGSLEKDTVTINSSTGGTESSLMISSKIIPETNYKASESDFKITTLSLDGTNYDLDGSLSIGLDHANGGSWSDETTALGLISISSSGSVLAYGKITTSFGTFDAILIKDKYETLGKTLTYYSWETKEFGRIATLSENNFSLMTQNNFNIITKTEKVSLSELKIFPNPAKDNFTVKINALENVKVFDAIGNLVFNQSLKSNSININTTNFNRGLYFLQATANGNVATSRIIVK
jgi:hypothetical protein